ncbi:MAG: hypothetical protein IKS40_00485 [Treponema sp.]|nr:hypothetical protein [Treponema sp.]
MTDYEIEMELEAALEAFPSDRQPVNLSYWNSGSDYKKKLEKRVKLYEKSDLFDYRFWFSEKTQKDIALKLGFSDGEASEKSFSFLSQSTLSIATLTVFLKKHNKKVGIIEPAYFSVQSSFDNIGLPYRLFGDYMEKINSTFDAEELLQSDCTAFWFTSPLNSCSIYFKEHVTKGIQKLLDAGKMVVMDESLCINGFELSRVFGIQENLIYIYSPHKALGIQGIKFSCIAEHTRFYDEINSIKDVHGGALNYSCQQAADHFISDSFDECLKAYTDFWQKNLSLVKGIVKNYDFARIPLETSGHYAMVLIDRYVDDENFVAAMKQLMKETGYFVYPGIMHGFHPEKGICFRVNLLLNSDDIEKGLVEILEYFKGCGGK